MKPLTQSNTCIRCGIPKIRHTKKQLAACSAWVKKNATPCKTGNRSRISPEDADYMTRLIHRKETLT